MLATVHTIIVGWDVVVALLALLVAVLLDGRPKVILWVPWVTLFAVVLFGCALTVRF